MKILYFAWLRERIGIGEEDIELPADVATIGDLMSYLAGRGEEYAYAFENPQVVRASIDQVHVKPGALIAGAREIAFFPPMTGG
jgi:molybdopterin synthase sulfur carrier subunit